MQNGRYYCDICNTRFDSSATGSCPNCEDQPLLDLADEDVRLMLADMNDDFWAKHSPLWALVAPWLAAPLVFPLMLVGRIYLGLAAWGVTTLVIGAVLFIKLSAKSNVAELSDETDLRSLDPE